LKLNLKLTTGKKNKFVMSRHGRDAGPTLTPDTARPGAKVRVINAASRWGNIGICVSDGGYRVTLQFDDGVRQAFPVDKCQLWRAAPDDLNERISILRELDAKHKTTIGDVPMPAAPHVATVPDLSDGGLNKIDRSYDELIIDRPQVAEVEEKPEQKIMRKDAEWDF
jgi:hypothetical protein